MKIKRDFQHGTFAAKAEAGGLTEDQMKALGRDTLVQLRDVAGVLEGEVPEGIAAGGGATQADAMTADQAEEAGTLTSGMVDSNNADATASSTATVDAEAPAKRKKAEG